MKNKTGICLSLCLLFGLLMVGCSDDVDRITSPASSELVNYDLGTSVTSEDIPDANLDGYISYEDWVGIDDQDDGTDTWYAYDHDDPDVDDHHKPIDNGLETN